MAINQITKVLMPDGTEVGIHEWSDRPLYSTATLLTAMTDEEIRLFTYGEGDTVSHSANLPAADRRTANQRDTNITSSSEMDATEEYLVYEIAVELHQFQHATGQTPPNETDVVGLPWPAVPNLGIFHHAFVLALEVSEKDFPKAGVGFFPAGFGLHGFAAGVDANGAVNHTTWSNNGLPSAEARRGFMIPHHLGGTEDYAVILENPGGAAVTFRGDDATAPADIWIEPRVYLIGLHKRPTG